eukprot:scaffold28312_cov96-Isochrysis_galbana.AAC.1
MRTEGCGGGGGEGGLACATACTRGRPSFLFMHASECEPSGGQCALLGASQQHGCVALYWAQCGQCEGGEGWVGSCSCLLLRVGGALAGGKST